MAPNAFRCGCTAADFHPKRPKPHRLTPFLRSRRSQQRYRCTEFAPPASAGRLRRTFSKTFEWQNGCQALTKGPKSGSQLRCGRTVGVLPELPENVQKPLGNLWFLPILESRTEAKLKRFRARHGGNTLLDAFWRPTAVLEPPHWPQRPPGAGAGQRISTPNRPTRLDLALF